jgi:hypothetical protein
VGDGEGGREAWETGEAAPVRVGLLSAALHGSSGTLTYRKVLNRKVLNYLTNLYVYVNYDS